VTSECPHCHTTVLLSPTGECPACRENVNDLARTDPNVTRVVIDVGLRLPSRCMLCGAATQRTQSHRVSRPRSNPPTPQRLFSSTITVVVGLLQLLYWRITRAAFDDIVFHLPVCQKCHDLHRQITIGHVDWESRRATVLAHIEFTRQLTPTPRGYHSS
jgi:hypothetical protein